MNLRFSIFDLRLARPAFSPLNIALLGFATALHAAPAQTPSDDIPPLAPPLPEIPPTLWEQHGALIVIGAVVLLALTGFALWAWLRPKPVPPVPPEVLARQELSVLANQPEDGRALSQLSQILRRYVVAAFGLPPGEATTTELCATLVASDQIGPELAGAFGEFLRGCDERKFAPGSSQPPLGAASRALALVELAEMRKATLRQPSQSNSQT